MAEPRKSLSVINPNDKVQQLRDAFAAEGGASPHASTPASSEGLHAQVVEALRTVFDPEIPVNIYDLGLVYDIAIDAENRVTIRMTLTAPGCPVADQILADVETKVENVDAVKSCKVDLVFDPPWTKDRMSEAALLELGLL
jgi:FeS assembly SUF system protein